MFRMGTDAWVVVVRTLLVYLGVFVGLRLAGKRELGQMTVFDLVVVLLISNAVQNAMVGPDFSVQRTDRGVDAVGREPRDRPRPSARRWVGTTHRRHAHRARRGRRADRAASPLREAGASGARDGDP